MKKVQWSSEGGMDELCAADTLTLRTVIRMYTIRKAQGRDFEPGDETENKPAHPTEY